MNLKTILTGAALLAIGVGANAANVTDWGTLGPVPSVAIVNYTGPQVDPIDDVYTFNIGDTSDVDAYAEEFEARSVSMPGATFTLFLGAWGDPGAVAVGSPFTFSNTATETVYSNLASGNYYFEVQGGIPLAGASYDFEAFANSSSPPLTVPEPASGALLLAGIGIIAFLGSRRHRQ